ncbi:hypothetical protein QBC38DRAFT_372148 [Podospora fimiseda]|uniref:Uncharacterized protein n=1 Tax=Podospora fimiseda TaxID=252190 RepID=A0AAN7BI98_9PEZI|nr:hypothetical protein QBC38DRAFT_372148 [Podospora fimiseda]
MNSLAKFTAAALSVTNENTAALVNINLDISLFRCDPPSEFLPVGSALTVRRREEAETGQTHRTASNLGFLFQDIIPDTPLLIKAYGSRVSEILSHPDVNPKGTESDGPFQNFVGADCTSIWAAATSGAIGVLLLACMLSDAWNSKQATSIWVELIADRKRMIRESADRGKFIAPHIAFAAQQEYTRSELASWDASVRSWLRRAATSMKFQHTQLALITSNITVAYPRGGSTYETVTMTWRRAMEVLENLLNNLPQEACDRAIIRGISAWHLYPDLLVFQPEATHVRFRDSLFQNAAILSLGLEYKGKPSDNYIRWSLALSHLRYYGDPVAVRSNEQLRRIHVSQLWLIALGSIFYQWEVPYANLDTAFSWFEELGRKLGQIGSLPHEISWLVELCKSASGLDSDKRDFAGTLIQYGYRRGAKFWGPNAHPSSHLAFFGLCNPQVMRALSCQQEVDCGITYLRQVCSTLRLDPQYAIICYEGSIAGHEYSEYCSITPVEESLIDSGSYTSIEETGAPKVHARWVHCPLAPESMRFARTLQEQLGARAQHLQSMGEVCRIVTNQASMLSLDRSRRTKSWYNPPGFFGHKGALKFKELVGPWGKDHIDGERNHAFTIWVRVEVYDSYVQLLDSHIKGSATQNTTPEDGINWLRDNVSASRVLSYLLAIVKAPGTPAPWFRSNDHLRNGDSDTIQHDTLKRKRPSSSDSETSGGRASHKQRGDQMVEVFSLITLVHRHPLKMLLSLRALEVVVSLYQGLPFATISMESMEHELLKGHWLPRSLQHDTNPVRREANNSAYSALNTPASQHLASMSRPEMFSCIAFFESGHFNIDPQQLNEVVALCHEDAIFVSEILLSDPGTDPEDLKIRHIVGNIGMAGMTFLLSPPEPRIRAIGQETPLVSHSPYNGALNDTFQGTSLHLSFTTWKFALDYTTTGEIDQDIFLVESVVSVQHKGKWVADIDVLELEKNRPDVISFPCNCEASLPKREDNVVAISSWDEFLDPPPCTGVLQTNQNWVARLAAASILTQQGNGHTALILGEGKLCWKCLCETYSEPEVRLPHRIIL